MACMGISVMGMGINQYIWHDILAYQCLVGNGGMNHNMYQQSSHPHIPYRAQVS